MSTVISLARKWRPQTFSDLVGQESVFKAITFALKAKNLPQAYLFSGDRGVGKTTVARLLAKSINCKDGPTTAPCLSCSSCLEIAKGSSPDVMEIDGASNTSVDDVRSLREGIHFLPFSGRARIYIIDEVHMLSTAAFNALLKTLEEPPSHVIFIFATTEAHKVPDTIQSRCQHFRFRNLTIPEIKNQLQKICLAEGLDFSPEVLNLLSQAAEGSLRDALSLTDQIRALSQGGISLEDISLFLGMTPAHLERDLLDSLLSGKLPDTLKIAENLLSIGIDPRNQLKNLSKRTRDLLMSSVLASPLTGKPFEWMQEAIPPSFLTGAPTEIFLEQMLTLLLRGEEELRKSPQPSITFLLILCRICHLKDAEPLAQILASLRNSVPDNSKRETIPSKPISPEEKGMDGNQKKNPDIQPEQKPSHLDIRIPGDWKRFLREIKGLEPHDRELLEECQIQRTDPKTITLFVSKAFFESRVREHIPLLRESFLQREGESVTILTKVQSQTGGPKIQSPVEQAKDHHLVKEAQNIFGAEIISVKNQSSPKKDP
jgi:DNA polymerase-3 subunit gamma/tau